MTILTYSTALQTPEGTIIEHHKQELESFDKALGIAWNFAMGDFGDLHCFDIRIDGIPYDEEPDYDWLAEVDMGR